MFWPSKPGGIARTCTHPLAGKPAHAFQRRLTHFNHSTSRQTKAQCMAVDQYSCFRKTPSSREKEFLSRIFRDSIATPFCLQRALWSHCGCCSYACKHGSAGSHRHSPLPLSLAGDVFADLSRNLLQNSPANIIDLHHSQHRQGINNASVGAAYLPILSTRERGLQICKCTGMPPPRIQRGIFREKISFFRELHRRSFAEGFKPRRVVTKYITPCKDLLINLHIPQSQPKADWPRRATRSGYNYVLYTYMLYYTLLLYIYIYILYGWCFLSFFLRGAPPPPTK